MPHLAPLQWMLMPLMIVIMIYLVMVLFYFQQPTGFPHIKITKYKMPSWKW